MPFAEFMDVALYAEGGYYMRLGNRAGAPWGEKGDYFTSLDSGVRIFAAALCRQIYECWQRCNSPSDFALIEGGAGRGLLTFSVLDVMKERYGALYEASTAVLVERNAALHVENQAHGSKAVWVSDITKAGHFMNACVYSNELFDALPFHRGVVTPEGPKEIFVGLDKASGSFGDVILEPSFEELGRCFMEVTKGLPVGSGFEVSPFCSVWLGNAAKTFDQGFVVTIDYGAAASKLYASGRGSTLHCHYKHTVNNMPYERIGEQDITAHVDFTALKNAGSAAGLTVAGFTTQRQFLLSLGILDELTEMPEKGQVSADTVLTNQSVKNLVMPGGISDTMMVLAQAKGFDKKQRLSGFTGNDMQDML